MKFNLFEQVEYKRSHEAEFQTRAKNGQDWVLAASLLLGSGLTRDQVELGRGQIELNW